MNKITRSFIYEKPTTSENCDFRLLWKGKHNMNFKYRQGVFLETNDRPSELVAFVQNSSILQTRIDRGKQHRNKLRLLSNTKTNVANR